MSRLPTHLLVAALRQQVQAAGGFATILAKGDAGGGTMLLILREPGTVPRAVERVRNLSGGYELVAAGDAGSDEGALDRYWQRRRSRDPDLWVIELDTPEAERLVAATILDD